MKQIRVGTRGSLLALRQCYAILAELQVAYWASNTELLSVQVIPIRTEGDRAQGTENAGNVTKKAWVEDIEKAIVANVIDFAIHSGKDLPHDLQAGTALLPIGERKYPSDVFVGKLHNGRRIRFEELCSGMKLSTGSLRRKRFIQGAIEGIQVVDHRGNVPTRIKKLDEDATLSGIVLAEAGIKRLGLDVEYEFISPSILVPAQNQGTLVAQFRLDDPETLNFLNLVLDLKAQREFDIEREVAKNLMRIAVVV
jgi:hydroxymethylbilane synthase